MVRPAAAGGRQGTRLGGFLLTAGILVAIIVFDFSGFQFYSLFFFFSVVHSFSSA